MADAKRSLDYWRKFFGSAKTDIFELIEKAIVLAAVDRPNEFKEKKDMIAEKLQNSNNGDDDPRKEVEEKNGYNCENPQEIQIDKEVMRIKQVLCSGSGSDEVLYEALKTLQLMEMSVETLKRTEIGRMVNALRKHSSVHIRNLVLNLVNGWKLLVDQWVKSTAESTVPISEEKAGSHSSSGAKRKQVEEVEDMSRLEIAKKKLHDGYQRAEIAKKRRMIQVIEPGDLPVDSSKPGGGRRRRLPAF
ncbi:probable mediator of RNA polymerase II transcription subunit 26b [Phalaenopsis equestris]|nr:probable mediator of RNA polymerase II transcription subunit 26b [Phalaenopsis equestris]